MGEKIEESTLAPGRGKIGQRRGEEEGENGIGGRNGRNNKSARDGQWIDKTRDRGTRIEEEEEDDDDDDDVDQLTVSPINLRQQLPLALGKGIPGTWSVVHPPR
ncbi:fungal specific transcription factor [Aspergillus luchuensis]|uniref:Fungal specific transcription factor n=1 Tax=Aspergillus kawachii TaxID=1069201 RepID=A0A146FJ53_ASPKA|nr:fungal specific transcription factor [Aspergillus luchuensis]